MPVTKDGEYFEWPARVHLQPEPKPIPVKRVPQFKPYDQYPLQIWRVTWECWLFATVSCTIGGISVTHAPPNVPGLTVVSGSSSYSSVSAPS